jgi:hypothetical protein
MGRPLLLAGVLLASSPASARLSSQGEVALEGRAFIPDDLDSTDDLGAAVAARLEVKGKHKPVEERLRLLARVGGIDTNRSTLIVEEAWAGWKHGWLRVRAGVQILNWTATEAFHPADVVNSRNFDSNVENAEKVGEPMVEVRLKLGTGSLTGYYLPARMDPRFPGPASRLSFAPAGLTLGDPVWGDADGSIGDGRLAHQWAARLSQSLWGADLALHVISHNDRSQPSIVLGGDFVPRPLYHRVLQAGATWTQTLGEWIVKVEAAHRRFEEIDDPGDYLAPAGLDPPDHTQVAAGLEWGWGYDSGGEGTVLAEGQVVLGVEDKDERRALHPFQRDVLIGYRHAFNDANGSELMLGILADLETVEVLGNLNYKQRLSDTWSLEVGLRFVHAPSDGDPFPEGLEALHEARYAQLFLKRYF